MFITFIKEEMMGVCDRLFGILRDQILNQSLDLEMYVKVNKMVADYFRYIAEVLN